MPSHTGATRARTFTIDVTDAVNAAFNYKTDPYPTITFMLARIYRRNKSGNGATLITADPVGSNSVVRAPPPLDRHGKLCGRVAYCCLSDVYLLDFLEPAQSDSCSDRCGRQMRVPAGFVSRISGSCRARGKTFELGLRAQRRPPFRWCAMTLVLTINAGLCGAQVFAATGSAGPRLTVYSA